MEERGSGGQRENNVITVGAPSLGGTFGTIFLVGFVRNDRTEGPITQDCQEIIPFHIECLLTLNWGFVFCAELAMLLNGNVDQCMGLAMPLNCKNLLVIMGYDIASLSRNWVHGDDHLSKGALLESYCSPPEKRTRYWPKCFYRGRGSTKLRDSRCDSAPLKGRWVLVTRKKAWPAKLRDTERVGPHINYPPLLSPSRKVLN